jgi:hypothetical protein
MVVREDVRHRSRRSKSRSAARRPDADIIGGRSAAAVPGVSARGAGFGRARMGVQDSLFGAPVSPVSVEDNRQKALLLNAAVGYPLNHSPKSTSAVSDNRTSSQRIISLFPIFSSTSPSNRAN